MKSTCSLPTLLRIPLQLLLFVLSAQLVRADAPPLVMTFDGATDQELVYFDDYIENGIKMSVVYNHYDLAHDGANGYVNIDTYPHGINCAIKFELVGGGLFHLKSVAATFLPQNTITPAFADYKFEFSDGSSFTPTPVDGTVVLESEFALLPAISYFIYSTSPPNPRADFESLYQRNTHLDNITIVVPEPAGIAVFFLGASILLAGGRGCSLPTGNPNCPR